MVLIRHGIPRNENRVTNVSGFDLWEATIQRLFREPGHVCPSFLQIERILMHER